MKTNHKEAKQKETHILQCNLTPERMMLSVGDIIHVYKPAQIEDDLRRKKRRVPATILKLYRNHALCQVGRMKEAFTYAEIAQGMVCENEKNRRNKNAE